MNKPLAHLAVKRVLSDLIVCISKRKATAVSLKALRQLLTSHQGTLAPLPTHNEDLQLPYGPQGRDWG